MKKGAKILVGGCAGVKAGEDVLIVTDAERLPIAQALCAEAQSLSARPTIAVCPPRSIDNEEPPRAVAEAMRASDVVFLPITHALAHTRATREAIGAGARVLSMTAYTPGQMEEGGLMADFRARKPLCDALAARLSEAQRSPRHQPGGHRTRARRPGTRGQQPRLCSGWPRLHRRSQYRGEYISFGRDGERRPRSGRQHSLLRRGCGRGACDVPDRRRLRAGDIGRAAGGFPR